MTEIIIKRVIDAISGKRFTLNDEKTLQSEIQIALQPIYGDQLEREKILDKKNIIDFFIDGLGIEVKIAGSKKEIYKQCKRYCEFENITTLILVTNVTMGFPEQLNGKDCYMIKLGMAWL